MFPALYITKPHFHFLTIFYYCCLWYFTIKKGAIAWFVGLYPKFCICKSFVCIFLYPDFHFPSLCTCCCFQAAASKLPKFRVTKATVAASFAHFGSFNIFLQIQFFVDSIHIYLSFLIFVGSIHFSRSWFFLIQYISLDFSEFPFLITPRLSDASLAVSPSSGFKKSVVSFSILY